jgi:hypothetical protein
MFDQAFATETIAKLLLEFGSRFVSQLHFRTPTTSQTHSASELFSATLARQRPPAARQ